MDTMRTLADGTTVTVPENLAASARGVDLDGDLVIAADWTAAGEPEYLFPLTPCCLASGKGSDSAEFGVVCRSCYQEVDPKFGMFTEPDELRPFA
jgi:hypothetical protein